MIVAGCSDGSILFRFGYASEIAGSVALEEAEGSTDVEKASKCEETEVVSDVGDELVLCSEENDGYVVQTVDNSRIELEDEIVFCRESDNKVVEDVNDSTNRLEGGIGLKNEIVSDVPKSDNDMVEDRNDGRNGLENEIALSREQGDVPEADINVVEAVNNNEIGLEDGVGGERVADIESDPTVVVAIDDGKIGLEESPLEESVSDIPSSDSFRHVVRLESEVSLDSENNAVEQDRGQILKPVGVSELDFGFNIEKNGPEEDFEGHVENGVSTVAAVSESEICPDLETDCGSEENSEEKNDSEPMVLLAFSEPHSVVEVVNGHGSSESQVENLKIKDMHVSIDDDAEASRMTDEVAHESDMIRVESVCAVVGPEQVLDEETSHGSVQESAETHGTENSIPVCTISPLTIHFEC